MTNYVTYVKVHAFSTYTIDAVKGIKFQLEICITSSHLRTFRIAMKEITIE